MFRQNGFALMKKSGSSDYSDYKAQEVFYPIEKAVLATDLRKRVFDFIVSLVLILFLLPFLTIIAIICAIDTKSNPIFVQKRTGLGGFPFLIFKFKSMVVSEDGNEVSQAVRDDQRITKFGKFIRKTSIDELPQLFNVLNGTMSLVGPRPHAIKHDLYFSTIVPDYYKRFAARPGITGLAQISGFRGPTETNEKIINRTEYDIKYIESWSFLGDLKIIIKTAIEIFFHDAF